MCIVFFDFDSEGLPAGYKFVVAATREEFLGRPTADAGWWEHKHDDGKVVKVLSGRDLEHVGKNGTWLGISSTGRFAALTNYRRPNSKRKMDGASRGLVPSNFLTGSDSLTEYLSIVEKDGGNYDGFNLVVADMNGDGKKGTCGYVTNMENRPMEVLKSGTFGVTNKTLDDPWPKLVNGKTALKQVLSAAKRKPVNEVVTDLIAAVSNTTQCAVEELPDTGVPHDLELAASSIFMPPIVLHGKDYGTRTQTIILVDTDNHVTFVERTMNYEHSTWATNTFEFDIEES
eukprot:m.44170 g.44170  ORF g.44170 m.44170 type:complete len:287 (+) comp19597_c0_seq1:208-1068(+)